MNNIILETRHVGDISGDFFVPDYQRGYRWTAEEIKLMLQDIYENGASPYCLQPVVVKRGDDGRFELIDGQQRLTTIYLIYKYLQGKLGDIYAPRFTLSYQTREKSADFLNALDPARADENIDFHFIAGAFECIRKFFEEDEEGRPVAVRPARLTSLDQFFEENVSVIWYEVDSAEDGIGLFERLNIGKIPLTSSELVKALFLRDSAGGEVLGRQEEISLQWDEMEHALRDDAFWKFLSNDNPEDYPTRIDLILDLISGKTRKTKEKYHTFFYFDKEIKRRRAEGADEVLLTVWTDIHHVYLTLREWFANHNFYHKIGYLVASKSRTLAEIYHTWLGDGPDPLPKDVFEDKLDEMIRSSINIAGIDKLKELSYNDNGAKLLNVLLLFNVETERLLDSGKRRFPFDKHKDGSWSLEHIHAQHSEGLSTNDKILTWLTDHARILKYSGLPGGPELALTLQSFIDEFADGREPKNVRARFEEVQKGVVEFFTQKNSHEAEEEYRHNIANMALLDVGQNAALSNYVFDAKRDIIMAYDREGRYIPVCTKMVFFKYCSPASASLHFWGENDRKAYVELIDSYLKPYYTPANAEKDEDNDL